MINIVIRILQLKKLKTTDVVNPPHFIGKETGPEKYSHLPKDTLRPTAEAELETRKQTGAQG